jgi:hypothetical protein
MTCAREPTSRKEADAILGLPNTQEGVVVSNRAGKGQGLTMEVYLHSKSKPVTNEQCSRARVAAIVGGIEYVIARSLQGVVHNVEIIPQVGVKQSLVMIVELLTQDFLYLFARVANYRDSLQLYHRPWCFRCDVCP